MKLSPLQSQVAGHDGVLSMGENNEIVVKPVLSQELEFYEQACLHPEFQAWMPEYYGTLTLTKQSPSEGASPTVKSLNGFALPEGMSLDQVPALAMEEDSNLASKVEGDSECICLENVAHGFQKACLLDMKLGTQLYDESASEEKKARLSADAAKTTSEKLGLRLTGFHVYDSDSGEFTKYSKQYGKSLTEDTLLDGFRAFFSAKLGHKRMRLVIERFVNDLEDFLEMIKTQEVRLRASSLLLIYEGHPDAFDEGLLMEQEKIAEVVTRAKAELDRENSDSKGEDDEDEDDDYDDEDDELGQKVTDTRIIDFGRSAWRAGHGPDEGVILGVKNALGFLERLLEDYPSE
ncbi:hypothetical protein BGZ76_003349 [Entomortierella beljakovae]|nr:hypothetical protein BGZ76_003349 [Entomortierella beljakovae]